MMTLIVSEESLARGPWDPHKQKDAQLLEKAVQSLLDSLEWNSLEQCRLHNRLQMLYRINNRLVDIDLTSFCLTQIPGQEEPSDYIRSIPAILSYLINSSVTL